MQNAAAGHDEPHFATGLVRDSLQQERKRSLVSAFQSLFHDRDRQPEPLLLARTELFLERPGSCPVHDHPGDKQDDDHDASQEDRQAHRQGLSTHHGVGSTVATNR
jgi:hypothetical protein